MFTRIIQSIKGLFFRPLEVEVKEDPVPKKRAPAKKKRTTSKKKK